MTAAKRRRRRGFYAEGVPGPDEAAGGAESEWADEVVEVMRARVTELMSGRPEDIGLLMRTAQALVRTAAAGKQLSRKEEGDLGERLRRVLTSFGPELGILPAEGEEAGG
jgi:hypothetical protein